MACRAAGDGPYGFSLLSSLISADLLAKARGAAARTLAGMGARNAAAPNNAARRVRRRPGEVGTPMTARESARMAVSSEDTGRYHGVKDWNSSLRPGRLPYPHSCGRDGTEALGRWTIRCIELRSGSELFR